MNRELLLRFTSALAEGVQPGRSPDLPLADELLAVLTCGNEPDVLKMANLGTQLMELVLELREIDGKTSVGRDTRDRLMRELLHIRTGFFREPGKGTYQDDAFEWIARQCVRDEGAASAIAEMAEEQGTTRKKLAQRIAYFFEKQGVKSPVTIPQFRGD